MAENESLDLNRPYALSWKPVLEAALKGDSSGMTGSMSTRSCHPEFPRRMSRRVSLVTGRDITFRLPFHRSTKGEIIRWEDIESAGRLPEPVHRYLLETQILKSGESPAAIIDLLARNRDEWKGIVAERRRLGFRWARLLNPALTPIGRGVSNASA